LIWTNFPLFSFLRQNPINVFLNDIFFAFLFSLFFFVFDATDIFWTIIEWNNYFFLYAAKSRRRRNWTLRNFYGNNKKRKFQMDITWLMEPSSLIPNDANLVITWSRNAHAKTPILGKPSKSCLIGVWHEDNLYLGTNTIGNGDPHPTNIDLRTRSIMMTPRRQFFFDKSFSVL